jgi:hypothetical protein
MLSWEGERGLGLTGSVANFATEYAWGGRAVNSGFAGGWKYCSVPDRFGIWWVQYLIGSVSDGFGI